MVTFENEKTARGCHVAEGEFRENGDLVLSGQDLGDLAEEYWGHGLREYEWSLTIPAAVVPRFIETFNAALSARGIPSHATEATLLCALQKTWGELSFKTLCEENDLDVTFWSRVGD